MDYDVLNCELEEAEGHTHSDDCYGKKLICQQEAEAQSEGNAFFSDEQQKLPESSEEQPGEEESLPESSEEQPGEEESLPESEEKILICGKEEIIAHEHTKDCYEGEMLICEQTEIITHQHEESCFSSKKLTCELKEHTHSAECYLGRELTEEEHKQIDEVIDLIDALPASEEIEARIAEYEDAEDEDGLTEYLTQVKKQTVKAWKAYDKLGKILQLNVTNSDKLMELEWLWSSAALEEEENDASVIKESLDGDYAYLRDVQIKTVSGKSAIKTGTSPFDATEGAGNDTSADDLILRTFDTATYTIEYYTSLRQEVIDQNISGYKQGRVYFEFILPLSEEEAQFETGSMLWLESSQEIKWEKKTVDKVGQVLRGSFLLVPNEDNPAAIGASQNELSVVIRALRMQNEEKMVPKFTLWLEYNDVGTTYADGIPQSIVTDSKHSCTGKDTDETEHGQEYSTITAPDITISAAPLYNVAVVECKNAQNTVIGTYDFNTGSANAVNYGMGSQYGRLTASGLLVEIRGKSGQGLRGVELPSTKHPIKFTLKLSSYYKPATGTTDPEIDKNYQALLYSAGGNSSGNGDNPDGRKVDAYNKSALMVPYNKLVANSAYKSCADGGSWSFEAVSGQPGTYQVTVKDFKIDTSQFPQTYVDGTTSSTLYYNPGKVDNWWDIERAVFSAAELWVVQPYNSTGEDKTYIVNDYGVEGQFFTEISISDFSMTSESGTSVTTQTITTDDSESFGKYVKNPGSIDAYIAYLKNKPASWDDALTEGAARTDNDWATAGQGVTIRTHTAYRDNDGEYLAVGFDTLVKFDDEFFEPDGDGSSVGYKFNNTSYLINGSSWRLLWAAKPDKTGWTNDEEMKKATEDDLVYYTTLEDLKNAGAVCVGALAEWRGVQRPGGHNVMLYLYGHIKKDCPPNQVYMTTQCNYAWRKKDVQNLVAAYYKTSAEQLTDSQYLEYMTKVFPSRQTQSQTMLDGEHLFTEDYPQPFWRHDYYCTNGTGKITDTGREYLEDTGGSRTCSKATYDENGYHPGTGANAYQDSCLVVPYETTITKSTAQKEKGASTAKKVYDMNQNQRTVDFVLYPKISRTLGEGVSGAGTLETVVHVEDTLPKGLTYINGSAYLGGSYEQDPLHQKQGTITGGIQERDGKDAEGNYLLQEELTVNKDGTTTIRWSFPVTVNANTPEWTEPIRFSCTIGTPGDETTDVQHQQLLTNTVKVWSDGEAKREFKTEYGNVAQYGIQIQKSGALSLSKLADQLLVNWWDPMGFTMNIGNNSSTTKENAVIVESIPCNGVNGTAFHGALRITEFSAGTLDSDANSDTLLADFQFYYTSDEAYKGCSSASLIAAKTDFANNDKWKELILSDGANTESGRPYGLFKTTGGKAFPAEVDQTSQITAIVAVGDLPENKTLKMHITFALAEGEAQDKLVNYLSQESLVSSAQTQVVNRTLEGLAWNDVNANGKQEDRESRISGISVSLWKLKTNGDSSKAEDYEAYCYPNSQTQIIIETGKQISVQAQNSTAAADYEAGRYRFTDLPAGTYAVKFTGGTKAIKDYMASPANNILDDSLDSDGIAVYTDNADLECTMIRGIVLKEAKELTSGTGESKYHDSGFYDAVYDLTVSKTVEGNLGDRNQAFAFVITLTDSKNAPLTGTFTYTGSSMIDGKEDTDGGAISLNTQGEAAVYLKHGQSITIKGLPKYCSYKVEESDYTSEGYVTSKTGEDACTGVKSNHEVKFTNIRQATPPTGIIVDVLPYALMALLVLLTGGTWIFFSVKKKRRRS